jgi:uncharacterized protein
MKSAIQFLLRGYKRWISPMLPHACRFVPTCSEYALEAVERHGAVRGSWLAVTRLLRCHPFARAGHDPVPAEAHSISHNFDHAGCAPANAARESVSRHY